MLQEPYHIDEKEDCTAHIFHDYFEKYVIKSKPSFRKAESPDIVN